VGMLIALLGCPQAGAAGDRTVLRLDSGERRVALLELFSSQGCSSCPPAERWLSGLVNDGSLWKALVPVNFHVDYWDRLGWKDPFASVRYSDRQQRYQLHGHSKAVYTPGFVLAGSEWRGWFLTHRLPALEQPRAGRLSADIEADWITARYDNGAAAPDLRLNVALMGFGIATPVTAGENRGATLHHDFVVLAYDTWASDTGTWTVTRPRADDPSRQAIALWVSRGADPAPLQSTGGWLP